MMLLLISACRQRLLLSGPLGLGPGAIVIFGLRSSKWFCSDVVRRSVDQEAKGHDPNRHQHADERLNQQVMQSQMAAQARRDLEQLDLDHS